jgi:hypothetical protein
MAVCPPGRLGSALRHGLRQFGCASSGAFEQQFTLARIPGQRRRTLKLSASFVEAVKLFEEISAHARQ